MNGTRTRDVDDWGNHVEGRCPACGRNGTLFVAVGGWITCGWVGSPGCPDPTLASDWQENDRNGDELARLRRWQTEACAWLENLREAVEDGSPVRRLLETAEPQTP